MTSTPGMNMPGLASRLSAAAGATEPAPAFPLFRAAPPALQERSERANRPRPDRTPLLPFRWVGPPGLEGACEARLCVLASSSGGNCSVLACKVGASTRVCLIDAGLSPGLTLRTLKRMELSHLTLDAVLLTHLDHDHYHDGWRSKWPRNATLRLHRSHVGRAERAGTIAPRTIPFDGPFELWPGVRCEPVMMAHDSLGVAAFRIQFSDGSTLGFATDLGRAPRELIEHLRGVDVLAIESNYCPKLQAASSRPDSVKRRITGGAGHLSNEQALAAIEAIQPREHVVLLHLSRECNHPDVVSALHAGADYALTIAHARTPTRWIRVGPSPRSEPAVRMPDEAGATNQSEAGAPERASEPSSVGAASS
ncbi:MAG: MBL fold metallo-hydrolase [Planctomycetota bacterium]|nr:MBL fold metallo-hydrolase [Planctomycetota bacterium]